MRKIKCLRCGVEIACDKLDTPNRCLDWRCPTMTYAARMENAERVGRVADHLASLEGRHVDQLAIEALAELEGA